MGIGGVGSPKPSCASSQAACCAGVHLQHTHIDHAREAGEPDERCPQSFMDGVHRLLATGLGSWFFFFQFMEKKIIKVSVDPNCLDTP